MKKWWTVAKSLWAKGLQGSITYSTTVLYSSLHFTEIKFFPLSTENIFLSLLLGLQVYKLKNSRVLQSWAIAFPSNVKHRIWLVEYIQCLVLLFDSFNQEKHLIDFLELYTIKFRQCDFLLIREKWKYKHIHNSFLFIFKHQ